MTEHGQKGEGGMIGGDLAAAQDKVPAAVDERTLRFLKWLTITLTGTMILGIGAILLIIALRVPNLVRGITVPPLPETIVLPEGATPEAFVATPGWFGVVVKDEGGEAILLFDRNSGKFERRIPITRKAEE